MIQHNSFLGLIGNWQWYSDTFMVRLFLHLIISANTEDTPWCGTTLRRGTLATSVTALRAATGMGTKRIRSCLDRMAQCGEITIAVQGRFTIITLVNYDLYAQPGCGSTDPELDELLEIPEQYLPDDDYDVYDHLVDKLFEQPESGQLQELCRRTGSDSVSLRRAAGRIVDWWRSRFLVFHTEDEFYRLLTEHLLALCRHQSD